MSLVLSYNLREESLRAGCTFDLPLLQLEPPHPGFHRQGSLSLSLQYGLCCKRFAALITVHPRAYLVLCQYNHTCTGPLGTEKGRCLLYCWKLLCRFLGWLLVIPHHPGADVSCRHTVLQLHGCMGKQTSHHGYLAYTWAGVRIFSEVKGVMDRCESISVDFLQAWVRISAR